MGTLGGGSDATTPGGEGTAAGSNVGQDGEHAGGYYVMIDHEQSAGHYPTLAEARTEGQKLCDAEVLPAVFSIQDADGNDVEPIERSDGRDLGQQVKDFNTVFGG